MPGFFRCSPAAVFVVSRPLKDLTAILPGDTVACLQLADNGRRIPVRALTPGLFLIGSGPSCDLRLGEAGVPSLHSMIRVEDSGSQIALLCGGPPLLVRGLQVSCADLTDGDVLQIGGFRAVYRSVQATMAALHAGAGDESREQMLRLPEADGSPAIKARASADRLEELTCQLAENFRTLGDLQERQRALTASMQHLAEQLELLRFDQAGLPARRASA
ncbi:MAG: hypothetical protein RLZZ436_578 [Planctomycetota bacterium]